MAGISRGCVLHYGCRCRPYLAVISGHAISCVPTNISARRVLDAQRRLEPRACRRWTMIEALQCGTHPGDPLPERQLIFTQRAGIPVEPRVGSTVSPPSPSSSPAQEEGEFPARLRRRCPGRVCAPPSLPSSLSDPNMSMTHDEEELPYHHIRAESTGARRESNGLPYPRVIY